MSGTRISRLLFLARAMLDPTTELVGADNIPVTLACDRNGVLWVKQVPGGGGAPANPTPGWVVTNDPAANTQASCFYSNVGGTVVVDTISAYLSDTNAAATAILKVYLRDNIGGPIIWSANIQASANPPGVMGKVEVSGLNLVVPSGVAQLQFSAAGGANTQENVSMTGRFIV